MIRWCYLLIYGIHCAFWNAQWETLAGVECGGLGVAETSWIDLLVVNIPKTSNFHSNAGTADG